MRHAFDVWFFGIGRFYPGLIVEKYLVFHLFTNLVAYKLLLIVTTLIAVDMFRRCVQAYTTTALGVLSALMVVALFLAHGYQDALLAYNAMPQFVAIAVIGSLMAFRKALLERSRPMAALSLALYAAAALTYEDVYILCVLYPLLARFVSGNWRAAVRTGWSQPALALCLTIFGLAMRAWARIPPDALYAASLNPPSLSRTALYQLTAALPLAYWLAEPLRVLTLSPAVPIVFAGFAMTCWIALREVSKDRNERTPFLIGALLMILPALPIALVVKYQQELRLGLGYLPLFFQAFGVALLMAGVGTLAVRSRFRRAWTVAIAFLIATLGTVTYAANVQLVSADQPSRTARVALQRQISMGLMNPVPEGGVVSVPKAFYWIAYDDQGPDGISTRGLFYMFGHRRIDLEPPDDARAGFALRYGAKTFSWSLHRSPANAVARTPQPCNTSNISNGDFTFGFRCWARVAVFPGAPAGFPKFRIDTAGMCLPPLQAGNSLASIDVPGNAEAYIAQAFIYRGTPTTVTFRTWGTIDQVTVTVGIVFPVATGAGTERILDRFVPPAIQSSATTCSGRRPTRKSYTFPGFTRDDQIQLRLHATSAGTNGAIANFDDVTSSP